MHVDLQDGLMMNGHHLYHTHHGGSAAGHGGPHHHGGHHLVEEAILPDEAHDLQCGPGTSESADALQVCFRLK